MKFIAVLYLTLILFGTILAVAQPISTIDTVQNLEISRTQDMATVNASRIDRIELSVADLRNSINTAQAWVIGFGCCLSVLHVAQMLAGRKKNGNGNGNYALKDRY